MALSEAPYQIPNTEKFIADPRFLELSNAATPVSTMQLIEELLNGEQQLNDRHRFSQTFALLYRVCQMGVHDKDEELGLIDLAIRPQQTGILQDVSQIEPLDLRLRSVRVGQLGSTRRLDQRAPVLDVFKIDDISEVLKRVEAPFEELEIGTLAAYKIGHLIGGGRIEIADMLYEMGMTEQGPSNELEAAHRLARSFTNGNPVLGVDADSNLVTVSRVVPHI